MKDIVATVVKNNNMYYVKETKDGYETTQEISEATNFRFKFFFFNKKVFEESILNGLKAKHLVWINR